MLCRPTINLDNISENGIEFPPELFTAADDRYQLFFIDPLPCSLID